MPARNITESKILSKGLLSKRLGFVSIPEKINHWQLKQDHETFGINIGLRLHFGKKIIPSFSEPPFFQIPSNLTPYINEMEEESIKVSKHAINYSNLSIEEIDTLHQRSYNESITINSVDKDSGIVIWDRVDH